MHPIKDSSERRYIIQQLLKMLNRLLLRHIEAELAQYLFVDIAMLDMRNVRVDHKRDQVEDEVRALAEDRECCEAEVLEAGVVHGLDAAHGVDHLFADFDGRR